MIGIIMGSKSDWKVMRKAADLLKQMQVPFKADIVSAHRTPKKMVKYAEAALDKYDVILAGAGGAAHLPGMVASLTTVPVIGVPIAATKLEGLDALLSIVQMPRGIPVASVAIDNAENAALIAIRILALSDKALAKRLRRFQDQQTKKVLRQKLP